MHRTIIILAAIVLFVTLSSLATAQQVYRLPDLKSFKHLTTRSSDHAPDIPGAETTMDFYNAPSGEIYTIYSYRGRNVAFSVHSNSDIQKTYRIFMDMNGVGNFQEINRGAQWRLPAWVK